MRDTVAVILHVHVQYAHTCTLAFLNIPTTKSFNCICLLPIQGDTGLNSEQDYTNAMR